LITQSQESFEEQAKWAGKILLKDLGFPFQTQIEAFFSRKEESDLRLQLLSDQIQEIQKKKDLLIPQ